jgi:HPt (histidine-containing phosphotransfer) domain-containing protein
MASERNPPEVLDLGVVESMFRLPGPDGQALATQIIGMFVRQEPARIAGLRALAARRNPEDLGRAAHEVAGACAVIGAREMQMAALALENAARKQAWTEVHSRLQEIDAAWIRLQGELRARRIWPEAG